MAPPRALDARTRVDADADLSTIRDSETNDERSSQARLCDPQHAPRRLQRSGRALRRRADHGPPRLRLCRPYLLQRLLGHRRARSRQARRPSTMSPRRPTPGPCICRPPRTSCSSSTTRTCSRRPNSPTRRTITRARSTITPSEKHEARNWSAGMAVYDISKPGEPQADRLHAGRGHGPASHLVGSAGAGPTPRRCSTASPTTS